jgi:glycosyltransferase involved in cell wall biosynthesis
MAALLKVLAERHHVPFTIRTHSMDILSEPDRKLEAYCRAANSPWCKRILAFPASGQTLIDHGLHPEKLRTTWPVLNFQLFYKPEPRSPTGRVMCAGPAIRKKAHNDFVDLAVMMRHSDLKFDLYAKGTLEKQTQKYNRANGGLVQVRYADPEEMPEIYPRYDWLVYPSAPEVNKVGLPISIAEAMASGIGVCWQELPGRRQEQLDFLGRAGHLYKSIDELPEILSRPYPEEKRQLGFESARRFDIEQHKHLLSDVWNQCGSTTQPTSDVRMSV